MGRAQHVGLIALAVLASMAAGPRALAARAVVAPAVVAPVVVVQDEADAVATLGTVRSQGVASSVAELDGWIAAFSERAAPDRGAARVVYWAAWYRLGLDPASPTMPSLDRGSAEGIFRTTVEAGVQLGGTPWALPVLRPWVAWHEGVGDPAAAVERIEWTRTRLLETWPDEAYLLAYVDEELALLHEKHGDWDRVWETIGRTESLLAATPAATLLDAGREHLIDELAVLRAQVWIKMGLPDRAAGELRDVLPVLEQAFEAERPVKGALIGARRLLATLDLVNGRLERAIERADATLDELAPLLATKTRGRALMRLVAAQACELIAAEEPGRLDEACARFEAVLAETELDPLDRLESEARLARLEIARGRLDVAAEHLARARAGLAAQPGVAPRVRAFVDAAAAAWSVAGGEPAEAWPARRQALQASLDALVDHLAGQPVRAGGYGFQRFRTYRTILSTCADLALRLDGGDGARGAWDAFFAMRGLHSLARTVDAPSATPEDLVREVLDPGVGLLVVIPNDGTSHVFALDGEKLVHAPTCGMRDLRERVVAFTRDTATRSTLPEDGPLARAVREAILPPPIAERVASWHTILTVRSERLFGLRLEALPDGRGGYVGVTHALGELPSVDWALAAARTRSAAIEGHFQADLMWLEAPSPSPAWPDHPPVTLTEAQRDRATRAFARVAAFRGDAVTAARLTDAPTVRALHAVLHGVQDPRREAPTGLLMAPSRAHPDGAVFSDTVAAGSGSAPLVLLTACSIGAGPLRIGDGGTSSLTGAFLRAGALGVVSTSRDVHLGPTLSLMGGASDPITAGIAPAEALRRARAASLASGTVDVRTWTSVQATGLVHRPLFDPAGRRSPWRVPRWPWAVLVLTAVTGFVVARRRSALSSSAS